MNHERYSRLIDNAFTAYENSRRSGSEWGIRYWEQVILYLTRTYNRTC